MYVIRVYSIRCKHYEVWKRTPYWDKKMEPYIFLRITLKQLKFVSTAQKSPYNFIVRSCLFEISKYYHNNF